jgi:hypothetical protein
MKRKHKFFVTKPGRREQAWSAAFPDLMEMQPTRPPLQRHRESEMLARLFGG